MISHIIARMGGHSRFATLLTFAIHFFHALFAVVNYLSWVREQTGTLTTGTILAYLSLSVVCCVFYFFGVSVFYMWAWRFPEPEEVAKRRRIYGVMLNFLFCDLPLFIVETKIVWLLKFPSAIMGFTYCVTCISLLYSSIRVWLFVMVKIIKFRMPVAARLGTPYTTVSGVPRGDMDSTNAAFRTTPTLANAYAGNYRDADYPPYNRAGLGEYYYTPASNHVSAAQMGYQRSSDSPSQHTFYGEIDPYTPTGPPRRI